MTWHCGSRKHCRWQHEAQPPREQHLPTLTTLMADVMVLLGLGCWGRAPADAAPVTQSLQMEITHATVGIVAARLFLPDIRSEQVMVVERDPD